MSCSSTDMTFSDATDTHSSTQLHRFKDKTVSAAGSAPSLFQWADLFNDCLHLESLLSSQVLHVSLRKFIQLPVFTVNRRFNPSFLHYWRSDSNLSLVHTTWLIAKSSIHQQSLGASAFTQYLQNIVTGEDSGSMLDNYDQSREQNGKWRKFNVQFLQILVFLLLVKRYTRCPCGVIITWILNLNYVHMYLSVWSVKWHKNPFFLLLLF